VFFASLADIIAARLLHKSQGNLPQGHYAFHLPNHACMTVSTDLAFLSTKPNYITNIPNKQDWSREFLTNLY
jgi:hypothetical protein